MWWRVLAVAIAAVVIVTAGVIIYGARQWESDVRNLRAVMEAGRSSDPQTAYDPGELYGLPAPVERYFRAALREGQPLVTGASIVHSGTFNMGETEEQWKPFNSAQYVTTGRPGFVWDARITMAPGINAHVVDAYVGGEGLLIGKLLGLLKVVEPQRTPELSQGELMRYFAEGAWYPTALLPSQGVVWQAIDDTHALATLTDGRTTARLKFAFDDEGLISSVHSDGRYREINGAQVATPWEGHFWDYEWRDGMLIPLKGEVAWLFDEAYRPYWRGGIEQIEYDYPR